MKPNTVPKRRPKGIHDGESVYADFFAEPEGDECRTIYIGGPYYDGRAQIHLDLKAAKRLARWLTKAVAFVEGK